MDISRTFILMTCEELPKFFKKICFEEIYEVMKNIVVQSFPEKHFAIGLPSLGGEANWTWGVDAKHPCRQYTLVGFKFGGTLQTQETLQTHRTFPLPLLHVIHSC